MLDERKQQSETWRKAAISRCKGLGKTCACLLEQHEGTINAQARAGGGHLELVEKEYRGHIIWGLGGHNRESAFPLSGTGALGVLRAGGGIL